MRILTEEYAQCALRHTCRELMIVLTLQNCILRITYIFQHQQLANRTPGRLPQSEVCAPPPSPLFYVHVYMFMCFLLCVRVPPFPPSLPLPAPPPCPARACTKQEVTSSSSSSQEDYRRRLEKVKKEGKSKKDCVIQ